MAREILFRAKGQTSKKWHIGLLTYIDGICCHIENKDGAWVCFTDTICQYTGMEDKNGVKIFENDICKCLSVSDYYDIDCISKVFWDELSWMISESEHTDGMLSYFDMSKNYMSHIPEVEVIGNVFDNPELLEVSEPAAVL